mmetsp:Transcript_99652/g.251402  ORF Transcript_99652/g.251402 Transcript_99652/m.251402 type:complete len:478 (+) Transcript_99652:3-1436(+)
MAAPAAKAPEQRMRSSVSGAAPSGAAGGTGPGNLQPSGTHRYIKGTTIEKPPNYEGDAIIAIAKHPMNLLLIFQPLGIVSYYLDWGASYVFWFNFFAMIPLAKILGDATEELAASLKNDMLAGLLNATFGNAVEMVITVQTLRAGLFDVVKATLLGSVLSNTLLVLGMSFLCGGLWTFKERREEAPGKGEDGRMQPLQPGSDVFGDNGTGSMEAMADAFNVEEKIQSFSVLGALVNTSMLLISCMSFSLITVFRCVTHTDDAEETYRYTEDILLPVSRISSMIIMMAYVAYIFFQLVTHKEAMSTEGEDDGGEDEGSHLSVVKSTCLLFLTTGIVAFSSDLMVDAIEGVTEKAKLSEHFIGIILLPIVGNACEHAAAVRFAMQDKLGLSVSIAVGSSTQIALFAVPFSVIAGWVMRRPMDLNFGALNTSVMTVSVIVVLSMVVDGQSNWLQGYLLMAAYIVIAICYWHLPNELPEID